MFIIDRVYGNGNIPKDTKPELARPRPLLNLADHSVPTVDKPLGGVAGWGGDWDEKPEHLTPYLVAQIVSQALLELASSYDLGGGGSRRVASSLTRGLSIPLKKTQAERQ